MKEYGLDYSDSCKFIAKHGMTDKGFSQDKAYNAIVNGTEMIPMPRLVVRRKVK